MRVCHPGPVARHRSMTSAGKRSEISWRGFGECGRPPLFTTARASISSVSSGSSLYSEGLTTCESTRFKSEPKVRGEAVLFTIIGLSHAEDVAHGTPWRVPNNDESIVQPAEADDSALSVVLAHIVNLDGRSFEDDRSICEVEPAVPQRLVALGRIKGNAHRLLYIQQPCVATAASTCHRQVRHPSPGSRQRYPRNSAL